VKEYFDNIDKRISKLEPHPEEGASEAPAAGAIHRSIEAPSPEPMEEPRLRPVNTSRLVLEPVIPAEDSSWGLKSDSSARIPLESYSEPEGFGRAIAALVIILVLAGGAFAGFRYRAPLRDEFVTASQIVQQKIQQIRVTKTSATRSAPAATAPEAQAPEEQPPSQSTSIQPQTKPDVAISPVPTPPVKTQPAASVAGESFSGRREIADRARAFDDTLSSAAEAGAVRVNPAVMEANLIVSRVPVYPEAAKARRIQGAVVMQVIVSRQGTVRRVHVIEGDSRLRAAAIESVYKRQYTPYRLDGQPVEVATTVTVNFNLDR
jgi:TonB family protein